MCGFRRWPVPKHSMVMVSRFEDASYNDLRRTVRCSKNFVLTEVRRDANHQTGSRHDAIAGTKPTPATIQSDWRDGAQCATGAK